MSDILTDIIANITFELDSSGRGRAEGKKAYATMKILGRLPYKKAFCYVISGVKKDGTTIECKTYETPTNVAQDILGRPASGGNEWSEVGTGKLLKDFNGYKVKDTAEEFFDFGKDAESIENKDDKIIPSTSEHGMSKGYGGKGWYKKMLGEWDEQLVEETCKKEGITFQGLDRNNEASADALIGYNNIFLSILPVAKSYAATIKGDADVRHQIALMSLSTTQSEWPQGHPYRKYHENNAIRNLNSYKNADDLEDFLKGKRKWNKESKMLEIVQLEKSDDQRKVTLTEFYKHYLAKSICDIIIFMDPSTKTLCCFNIDHVIEFLSNPLYAWISTAPAEAIKITYPSKPTDDQRQVITVIEVRHDNNEDGVHKSELKIVIERILLSILKSFGIPYVSLDYTGVKVKISRKEFDAIFKANDKLDENKRHDLSYLTY